MDPTRRTGRINGARAHPVSALRRPAQAVPHARHPLPPPTAGHALSTRAATAPAGAGPGRPR
ncbi:hypothetical protein DT019_38485 [Streptomyces sp. SDr-06]|nr:hypothetical protein DT019_38485 [Streptomyces sp. SDr-06]